jgi:HK97 family phage major capsid protein
MSTKLAVPTDQGELESFLSDQEKVQNSIKEGSFQEVIKNYARAVNEHDKTILQQAKEIAEETMTNWLKENGIKNEGGISLDFDPKSKPNKYAAINNKRAIGAPLNGKYEDSGEFFQTVWNYTSPFGRPTASMAEKMRIQNTYQEKIPSDGGFLVPEEFRSELLRVSLESSVMRSRARVVPMGSLKLKFPAVDSNTNVGSVYGGVTAYWTEEGAELVASQSTFSSVELEAWKLTALASVTNELIRDASGGFQMYIEQVFPEAVAFFEDMAFLNGTGVGQPFGILNAANPATVTVTKETSQAAATINWNNIVKMYSRMLPSSLGKAIWLITPDALPQLMLMQTLVKNVAGTENVGGSAVWMPDAHGTPQLTLLGRPVVISEKVPGLLGTKGDISFVDPSMYLIGDRQQMTVDSTQHAQFTQDKTVFRVISRVDGRPWLNSAITPANNGPTMSPFVNLETRS